MGFGTKEIRNYCIKDKVYTTARKVSETFKKNMKIVFDNYLGKWNYTVVPKMKT